MYSDLISVVVPVYNVERYLDRCVSSIVGQTYHNLEIILVDDGSKDASAEICDDWASRDNRIRVIHKENAGAGMARNIGLENTNGDWVCFIDSDDYILPETIEKAVETVKKNSAQIVVFGMQNIGRDGRSTKTVVPSSDVNCFKEDAVRNAFLPGLIDGRYREAAVRNTCLSVWSGLFSMELIRKAGWRFVSEREFFSEDSYSLISLYQYVTSVAVLPEVCYCYCEHEASLSHRLIDDGYEKICQFYRECVDLVDLIGYPEEVKKSVSGLFISFAIAAMKQMEAADIDRDKKREMLRQILCDETMHRCLQDISGRTYSRTRRVLLWAIQHRCCGLCRLLLAIQNRAQK